MNRVELKAKAKQQISGNIGMYFLCLLIMFALNAAGSVVFVGGLILGGPLALGLATINIGLTKGEKVDINSFFSGFSNFGPALVTYLLQAVFTFLWSLLFIVPGIIKMLSYSMAFYILQENPEMTGSEAINESKRITKGYKGELFVIYLSFIPWYLLTMITFGIAAVYVTPYVNTTIANFYLELKQNQGE